MFHSSFCNSVYAPTWPANKKSKKFVPPIPSEPVTTEIKFVPLEPPTAAERREWVELRISFQKNAVKEEDL